MLMSSRNACNALSNSFLTITRLNVFLKQVSYSILLLFCGMFITVEGFNKTGIPSTLWNITKPHAEINRTTGMVVLALVILILSNIASNVPTGKFL